MPGGSVVAPVSGPAVTASRPRTMLTGAERKRTVNRWINPARKESFYQRCVNEPSMSWFYWNGTDLRPMPEQTLSLACSQNNTSNAVSITSPLAATTSSLNQNSVSSNMNEATISSSTVNLVTGQFGSMSTTSLQGNTSSSATAIAPGSGFSGASPLNLGATCSMNEGTSSEPPI